MDPEILEVGSAGREGRVGECLDIAGSLPEHFTRKAVEELMPGDLMEQRLLLASHGGQETIGFLSFETEEGTGESEKEGEWEITWLGVRPESQRKGVGRALVGELARAARDSGVKSIVARTVAPSVDYRPYEETRRFYEAVGFSIREVIDPYPGWEDGTPCAVYALAI